MTVRTSAPLGAPVWIDLATSDLQRAQQFYAGVFGWTFESAGQEFGGYVMAFLDGHPVAGLMTNDPQWNTPDGWSTYLHTADVDATLTSVAAAGGQSCGGAMDVPGKGRMGMVTDATGATVGLWQPSGHHGFEVVGEAGSPVWHQLTTRDYRKALDFYTSVFGWQLNVEADTDEFRYTNAIFDGEPLLGVMDGSTMLPDGEPSSWFVFLGADDVDKSLEVIVDLGGRVVRGAEDTPYGRLASATDTTGAGFNLASLSS
jgi:predicted enzyme related to lactoylglutathione lyase